MYRGPDDDVVVAHMPWRSGLEARVGGDVVGFLEYGVRGTWAVLARTDIRPGRRTEEIGHCLVRAALDLLRARGHRILPVCPTTLAYLSSHPEEADGIDEMRAEGFTPSEVASARSVPDTRTALPAAV